VSIAKKKLQKLKSTKTKFLKNWPLANLDQNIYQNEKIVKINSSQKLQHLRYNKSKPAKKRKNNKISQIG